MPAELKPERGKEDERGCRADGKPLNQQRRRCGAWRDGCTWHGLRFIAAFGLTRARWGGNVAQPTRPFGSAQDRPGPLKLLTRSWIGDLCSGPERFRGKFQISRGRHACLYSLL
jgi:hypothetical protein